MDYLGLLIVVDLVVVIDLECEFMEKFRVTPTMKILGIPVLAIGLAPTGVVAPISANPLHQRLELLLLLLAAFPHANCSPGK